MDYLPLWCKSHYSFLEGASSPEELVETAAAYGYSSMALTDRDGFYGAVRGHVAAKEQGISLIHGSEITLSSGLTVIALVTNRKAYADLCGLISKGRMRNPKGICSVTAEELIEAGGELILLFCRSKPAAHTSGAAPPGEGSDAARDLAALAEAFHGRCYALITRSRGPWDRDRENAMRSFAAAHKMPTVAGVEVLYHHKERRELQDVVTCIRHHVTLDQAGDILKPNAAHALPAPEDLEKLFADDMASLRQTREVADRCSFSLDEIRYRYPSERLPEGLTGAQWLRRLTIDGACRRYGTDIPCDVAVQLNKELELIEDLDYCGYFLTMWEIVDFCNKQGILCQGRGSAANSAVCYCLGITAIDPVRMDLLFERFLSRERAEPPDIDLDIEHRRREEVIAHMYKKYGRSHAAMVANVVRYRMRSALREVGKVLGFSLTALDRLAKHVSYHDRDLATSLSGAEDVKNAKEGQAFELLLRLADQIQEAPRHLSIHPGGFLLGSEPIANLVPVENATMPGRTVIQWDKYDVESMGLFKVDLLGLGALTHLDYCFALLEKHKNLRYTMAGIPAEDRRVYHLIGKSDTVGVFQLESRAQMAMLPRIKPRNFYDIVVEVSIVRPGPITGGMVHPYLRRRAGEEAVIYPHPSLRPVLEKTMGVPIFQEQVMKLAVVAANYTPGEADQLRRDMAAWRRSGRIEKHRDKLIRRMVEKGITEEFAEQVFAQIRGFGEYGFPESHAAGFALIAYATAWMRTYHLEVFVCGLLNAWPMGFYSPATIVADARRRGVEVRPISVLDSDWDCTLEPAGAQAGGARTAGATSYAGDQAGADDNAPPQSRPASRAAAAANRGAGVPDSEQAANRAGGTPPPAAAATAGAAPHAVTGRTAASDLFARHYPFAVRMGLRYVRGLGEEEWRRIKRARRRKPKTVEEFVEAARLPEPAVAALAKSGAFSCFPGGRRDALWRGLGTHKVPAGDEGELARDGTRLVDEEPAAEFAALNAFESIAWDYNQSGHSAEAHPLEPFREELRRLGSLDAAEVAAVKDGTRVRYVGLTICRQRPENAAGVMFVTLEDEFGFVNLIVWKKVLAEYRPILLTKPLLGVEGRVQSDGGTVHLVVDHCFAPELSGRPVVVESRDFR